MYSSNRFALLSLLLVACGGPGTTPCDPGFESNGGVCADVDECAVANSCAQYATCTNTPGSFTCACNAGFSSVGGKCVDIDECKTNNGGCLESQSCVNSVGSNSCACLPGFVDVGGNGSCSDVDECATANGGCGVNTACFNVPGSFFCECQPGFVGDAGACTPGWTSVEPTGRAGVSLGWDPARKRVVAYGGYAGSTAAGLNYLDETWEWDGARWLRMPAPTNPGKRSSGEMIWHEASHRLLLLGSIGETMASRSVWSWDGVLWRPVVSDESLFITAVAYDSDRKVYVALSVYDLYEGDGITWSKKSPSNRPLLGDVSLVYDAARHQTVMFGKTFDGPSETWVWDGKDLVSRAPAHVPPTRSSQVVAYDSVRSVVVLFGGVNASFSSLTDTWEWDGLDWTQRASSPSASAGATAVFDGSATLVLGGRDDVPFFWAFDGTEWKERASAPSVRADSAMAYDSKRQRIVLFGGTAEAKHSDTWEWDGSTWKEIKVSGPPALSAHEMAYDVAREQVVLSSYESGTWEFDGAWRHPVSPEPFDCYGLSYDAARSKMVCTTGAGTFETYERTGVTWAKVTPPASPTPRLFQSQAYDSVRGKTVLFGGAHNGNLADLWEWDGTTWTQRSEPNGPGAFSDRPMVGVGGRVAVFDGASVFWWDGTRWSRSSAPRLELSAAALAFDEARQQLVLFGGYRSAYRQRSTWVMSSKP